MNIARLSLKYTDHHIDDDALVAAHRRGGLDAALALVVERALAAVHHVETQLTILVTVVFDSVSKVNENLMAGPGQQVRSLNPLGELQANAARFDALIAMRADRIEHLQQLVHVWRRLPAHTGTATAGNQPPVPEPCESGRPAQEGSPDEHRQG